ncbi:hypothetical protein NIES267_11380 [Calothrix parasitica NIES-267]|uniref:Uncharacterized protein n=1 Tax=Calothrix parasitica NIES-267 TaxID=1973488 RepID=A0A1Z4LK99_9CYAN|nr:hypothetical protein NIES267_11380 [Calothrix parasitica NIES-267]
MPKTSKIKLIVTFVDPSSSTSTDGLALIEEAIAIVAKVYQNLDLLPELRLFEVKINNL